MIKRYLPHFVSALATFIVGISLYLGWVYFQSNWSFPPPATLISAPVYEPPNIIGDAPQNPSRSDFDMYGYYYIKGKAPKGFEDFDHIGIHTLTDSYILGVRYFGMVNLNIEDDQISFTTQILGNISYQFNGRIIAHENHSLETVVLKGQLAKIRKGRKIAESNISFTWYEGR